MSSLDGRMIECARALLVLAVDLRSHHLRPPRTSGLRTMTLEFLRLHVTQSHHLVASVQPLRRRLRYFRNRETMVGGLFEASVAKEKLRDLPLSHYCGRGSRAPSETHMHKLPPYFSGLRDATSNSVKKRSRHKGAAPGRYPRHNYTRKARRISTRLGSCTGYQKVYMHDANQSPDWPEPNHRVCFGV